MNTAVNTSKSKRQGWRQFAAGMVLYAVLIVGLDVLAGPLALSHPLVIVLTFAPVLAALWAMLGWIRVVRAYDELQQKIISEGLHWSLGLTGLLTFSYGLLEDNANLPKLSMLWVWPLICVTFALSYQVIARWRYR